jgi:hypothetical protein
MSQSLIEKIKKARQSKVTIEKITFVIARPTELDLALNGARFGINVREVLSKYVVDWEGMTELELVSGGMPDAVSFSTALFMEWVEDKPEYWSPLATAIKESYDNYKSTQEQVLKN